MDRHATHRCRSLSHFHLAWLKSLLGTDSDIHPLVLVHHEEAATIEDGFPLIQNFKPDADKMRFGCEGAFELFARQVFSLNRGSVGLEEKRLAM